MNSEKEIIALKEEQRMGPGKQCDGMSASESV